MATRRLIAYGCPEETVAHLRAEFGDAVFATADGNEAGDELYANPGAWIAYGSGVFGSAISGQRVRVHPTGTMAAVLAESCSFGELAYDDPNRFAWKAGVILRADVVVDVTEGKTLRALRLMMNDADG